MWCTTSNLQYVPCVNIPFFTKPLTNCMSYF